MNERRLDAEKRAMITEGARKVVAALNYDLCLEMKEILQYEWHHYIGTDNPEIVDLEENASREEMMHVERLAQRILELGGEPALRDPDVQELGQRMLLAGEIDLKTAIQDDLTSEQDAIRTFEGHISLTESLGDVVTCSLLQEIIAEERRHAATWMNTLSELSRDSRG